MEEYDGISWQVAPCGFILAFDPAAGARSFCLFSRLQWRGSRWAEGETSRSLRGTKLYKVGKLSGRVGNLLGFGVFWHFSVIGLHKNNP